MNKEVRYCSLNNKKFSAFITIIGKASEGWSCPDIVKIEYEGKEIIGYKKSVDMLGEKSGIEIVLGKMGTILGIAMADTICVFSDNTYKCLTDIISVSVVRFPNEYFINFREMRDELFYDLQNGNVFITPWITRWITICKRKNGYLENTWDIKAINDSDYYDSIQFAFEVAKLYLDKHRITLIRFQEEYIKMLMFDILVGQADRTPSNYGLLIDANLSVSGLAPLFDNSTLTKPYMKRDEIALNYIILKKERVAQVIYETYPKVFLDIRRQILEKKDTLRIIVESEYYLLEDHKKSIWNSIEEGLGIFDKIG